MLQLQGRMRRARPLLLKAGNFSMFFPQRIPQERPYQRFQAEGHVFHGDGPGGQSLKDEIARKRISPAPNRRTGILQQAPFLIVAVIV